MKRELERPLVVVEGISMAGKSTAIKGMQPHLPNWRMLREPGGTQFGDKIRYVVQDFEFAKPVDSLASMLLYSSSRAQLISEVIIPELNLGTKMLLDRWWYSTYSYQGGGEGVDKELIRAISAKVTRGLVPLTLFFDIAPELAVERRRQKLDLDRYDLKTIDFFTKVREAYKELGETVDHWVVIDASKPPEEVLADCLQVLADYNLLTE